MKLAKILAEKEVKGVISISADASLREAAKKLCDQKIGALLVTEPGNEEHYVGIISERDIIKTCCCENSCSKVKVSDFMTRNMIVATANDNVEYITGVMARHKIRHIPVISENKVAGIISMGDIIMSLHHEDEIKIMHLSDFFGGTYGSKVY